MDYNKVFVCIASRWLRCLILTWVMLMLFFGVILWRCILCFSLYMCGLSNYLKCFLFKNYF